MASILVVCTGNICRSPIGEGLLRAALEKRFGNEAPVVSSAGTIGWDGAPAVRESVEVAFERGVDIAGHAARRLTPQMIIDADLVLGMAAEHREAALDMVPQAADRTFTLKEAGRLFAALPAPSGDGDIALAQRVAAAATLRAGGFEGLPGDEDVVDPLNMPLATYRAVAWEIDEWTTRIADGIYGPAPVMVGQPGGDSDEVES